MIAPTNSPSDGYSPCGGYTPVILRIRKSVFTAKASIAMHTRLFFPEKVREYRAVIEFVITQIKRLEVKIFPEKLKATNTASSI